jgi:hypothetical protein
MSIPNGTGKLNKAHVCGYYHSSIIVIKIRINVKCEFYKNVLCKIKNKRQDQSNGYILLKVICTGYCKKDVRYRVQRNYETEDKIRELREQLYNVLMPDNLLNEETLKISRELDVLILKHYSKGSELKEHSF